MARELALPGRDESGQINMIFGADAPASRSAISRAASCAARGIRRGLAGRCCPMCPTISEFLPGYEASGWYGMVAPPATPERIVDKLNTEVNAALADPPSSKAGSK